MMDFLLVLFIIFAGSYILGEVFFRYLRIPKVIGPIMFGFLLNLPGINEVMFPPNSPAIGVLVTFKDIAVIFLLFFVGLKIDLKDFIKSSKRSFSVASCAFLLPFSLGYFLMRILGFDNLTSVIVAACISITAEAVAIDILEELKLLRTKMGEVIVEAGLIDDMFGIFLIAVITAVISTEAGIQYGLMKIVLEIFIFALTIFIIRYLVVGNLMNYVEKKHNKIDLFAAALMITLFLASVAAYLELGTIIGAVVAGILIRHTLFAGKGKRRAEMIREEHEITEVIEITTFGFLAPFFFVLIGLQTDLTILLKNPIFVLILIVISFIGKIFGSQIGNHFAGGKKHEGILIGWAMNIRGAVELIIATIALDHGLISLTMFSALVFMAFVTTLISPIMFKYLVKVYHFKHGIQ